MALEVYAKQARFVSSDARDLAFVAGIGAGKTYAGALRALRLSNVSGGVGLVAAPTYTMLKDSTLRSFIEIAKPYIKDVMRGDMKIRLHNGFEILFRSADDPDKLRGPNAVWFWLDEAALCHVDAWRVGRGRLRQFGRPGHAFATTTPRGRNWLYKYFVEDNPGGRELIRASLHDNVFVSMEFVKDMESAFTGTFANQELHGEFVAPSGVVYPTFDRSVHVVDPGQIPPLVRLVGGVDFGFTNPAVTLIAGQDNDGRIYVLDEFYKRRQMQDDHAVATVELRDRIAAEYPDAFAAAGLLLQVDPADPHGATTFRRYGLQAVGANNKVIEGIRMIQQRLAVQADGRPRLYISKRCANLLAEFEIYSWKTTRGELTDAPEKTNDHAMDALRYLVAGIHNQIGVRFTL